MSEVSEEPIVKILLKNELLLRTIFDTVPVGLLILNRQRGVTRVNGFLAELVDRELGEMMGRRQGNYLRCIHVEDDPLGCGYGPACASCKLSEAVNGALDRGESVFQIEHEMTLRLNGEEQTRSLRISVAPLPSEQEEPLVLVALEDVTEVVKRDKEVADHRVAVEQLKVLTETAGAVAHELSQPLQALVGSADLALLVDSDRAEMGDILRVIQANAARIEAMVRKMQAITSYTTIPYARDGSIVDLSSSAVVEDNDDPTEPPADGCRSAEASRAL